MSPRLAPSVAALAALLATGCFTARAAVGPNLATSGGAGVNASAGVGMGYSFAGHQAIYAVLNGGVVTDTHAHGQLFDVFSYVDYDLPVPVRVDARLGFRFGRARYGEAARAQYGAAIAVLPWYHLTRSSHARSEKGWGDIGPDLDAVRGLGLEVAVDTLPAPGPTERGLTMVTVSVVGDIGTMLAR
jgi:hypothetical protein